MLKLEKAIEQFSNTHDILQLSESSWLHVYSDKTLELENRDQLTFAMIDLAKTGEANVTKFKLGTVPFDGLAILSERKVAVLSQLVRKVYILEFLAEGPVKADEVETGETPCLVSQSHDGGFFLVFEASR